MTGQQQSKIRRLNRHWQSGGASVGKEQLVIYDSQYYEPVVDQYYPKDNFNYSILGLYNTADLTVRGYKSDSLCFPQVRIAQDGLYELKYNLTLAIVDTDQDHPGYVKVTDITDTDANSGIINIMLEMPQQKDEAAELYRTVKSPLTFQYAKEHGFSTVYPGAHYNYVAGDGNISGEVPLEYRRYCITDWNTNEFIPGENKFVSPYFNFSVFLTGQFKYFSHHEQNLNQRFLFNIKKPPYKYLFYDVYQGGDTLTLKHSKWTCPKITMWFNTDKFPNFGWTFSVAYFGKVWLERVGDYTQDQEWDPHV